MSIRSVFETFEKIASVSGRNAKIALIDALSAPDKVLLKSVVQYTYNPQWTYRMMAPDVANRPPLMNDLNDVQSDLLWNNFSVTLDLIRTRKMELARGRTLVAEHIAFGPPLYRKYLAQVVNRDLKIGIQNFDKWFPGMIPKEPVMLCEKWDGESLNGNWIAEPKLDGYRSAVVVDEEGNCEAISRGNKEFWNWEHIAADIKEAGFRNCVLDGEFFAGNFGLTGSICKTQKQHPDRLKLKYWIFDMLTMEEWVALKCTRTTVERKMVLARFLVPYLTAKELTVQPGYLVLTEGVPVHNPDEYNEAANRFYAEKFEGTVLKDMDAPYVWDRSNFWLKIKPEEEADVTVVGVKEGKIVMLKRRTILEPRTLHTY